ncbi:MAG: ribokinase [Planctomycetota bacterium]
MNKPLLVLGSINADLYVEVDRLPQPGETIQGGGCAVRPGGKGGNQAAAAAKLGYPTWFAGHLGNDDFAVPMRAAIRTAGADDRLLTQVAAPTGQAFILLQRGGENSIIVAAGANLVWNGLDAPIIDAIPKSGAVLLQRETPTDIVLAAARAGRSAGIPVILDAGGSNDTLDPRVLPFLSVFSPNEHELAHITGLPTTNEVEVLRAARSLQSQGVGTVLVKLGARGCLLVPRQGEPTHQASFPVTVVDTTGAGDCFTAAYTVAMLESRAEVDRLRFACAAAAICVSRLGAMPSLPNRSEVDSFLAKHSS